MERIRPIIDQYMEAISQRDTAQLMELYAEDVIINDAFGHWLFRGRSRWQAIAQQWLSYLGPNDGVDKVYDLTIEGSEALLLVSGMIDYIQGGEVLPDRFSWVLQPIGSSWQIVHEHTSIPIAMDTLRMVETHP